MVEEFKQWAYGTQRCTSDTVSNYTATVKQFCLGKSCVDLNTPKFFIGLTEELFKSGKALATVSRYVYGTKKFLVFLRDIYEVDIFDLDKVKCRRPKYDDPIILESEEIAQLRNYPIKTKFDLRDRTLFEFLLNTGCRINEATSLDIGRDLDFQRDEVHVLGKGMKPRTISIENCKEWLLRYIAERPHTSPWLFLTRTGSRLQRGNAWAAIKDFGRRAGCRKELHPHMFRATFITMMLENGVNPKILQRITGHEDLKTLLEHYYRISKKSILSAHETFRNALPVQQRLGILDK